MSAQTAKYVELWVEKLSFYSGQKILNISDFYFSAFQLDSKTSFSEYFNILQFREGSYLYILYSVICIIVKSQDRKYTLKFSRKEEHVFK